MSTDDGLDAKSDSELNELFAVEVLRKTLFTDERPGGKKRKYWEENGGSTVFYLPDQTFCTDANAVLPWLEKGFVTAYRGDGISEVIGETASWTIHVRFADAAPGNSHTATAPTFARAAVICLLRAKRASR